ALVHGPRLLLLDEPTVGVDPQSRSHIFDEVRRLNARGVTIVYTSHYMEEVQALCTRVGIIDHGRLIACDTLPALLQKLTGLLRDPRALVILLAMPFIFILVLGVSLGEGFGQKPDDRLPVPIVDLDHGFRLREATAWLAVTPTPLPAAVETKMMAALAVAHAA